MIAQPHRFHGHNSLSVLYRRSRVVHHPLLSLRFAERRQGRGYRLAIVVSRKVSKSAVLRNRIRRRLYEILRTQQDSLPPLDLVLTAFSDQLASLPQTELVALVSDLLTKAEAQRLNAPGHAIVKRTGSS